jgi:amino acid adenylation domain-containing protein
MSLEAKLASLTPAQKKQLLTKLQQKKSPIEKVANDSKVLLTPNQQRLRFLEEFHGASDQYHIPFIIEIAGELNAELLKNSISLLVERHRVLRCQIRDVDGESYQYIDDNLDVSLQQISHQDNISAFVSAPFSFEQGALIRFGLCQQSHSKFTFVIVVHHIIFDAGSTKVLFDELIENYQQLLYQTTTKAVVAAYDFIDYAQYVATQKSRIDAEFWHNKLDDAPQVHNLPFDQERNLANKGVAKDLLCILPDEAVVNVKAFAQQNQCSNNLLLTSLFSAFLARWSQEPDIILGVPYSHRERAEFDDALGFFINNLVYRADLKTHNTLEQLLSAMKQQQIDNIANAHTPFDSVVELINPARSIFHTPIFQICMNYQKASAKEVSFAGLMFQAATPPAARAKFDLIVTVIESASGFAFEWKYNSDLFHESTIASAANYFTQFIVFGLESPTQPFDNLALYSLEPSAGKLVDSEMYADINLFEQFSQQVSKSPTAIAFSGADKNISFQTLHRQVSALAHLLKNKHIEMGDVVAIALPSGIEHITAVLAVIANHATYVSLDVKAPSQRNEFIVQDSGAKLLIDAQFVSENFSNLDANDITLKDSSPVKEYAPAYICYTSGTTGKPKGVIISHQAVMSLVQSDFVPINENSRVLMCSNTAFDAMTFELWAPLLTGAMICHYPDRFVEPSVLHQLIVTKKINIAFITTALFRVYVAWLRSEQKYCPLEHAMVGGEKASAVDYRHYYQQAKHVQAYNIYGPTESTTFATIYPVPRALSSQQHIPIGVPMADAFGCVLNQNGQLQPKGMVGELYLGGRGLADAYLHNKSLTDEKFISLTLNGFSQRVYSTGDLVFQRADGHFIFLSRNDRQVKIRGFRIELDEVSATIRQCSGIENAFTRLVEMNQEPQLICYYVGSSIDATFLSAFARKLLPEYMVPNHWIALDELPTNLNGKTDIAKLPLPTVIEVLDSAGFTNNGQEALATIWQGLLPNRDITPQSHFFNLGGHSLLALKLLSQIKTVFNIKISLADIFAYPKLADLEYHIRHTTLIRPDIVSLAAEGVEYPLSAAQARLWLVTQLQKSQAEFHMPNILKLENVSSLDKLENALAALIQRHSALRTSFIERKNQVFQKIESGSDFILSQQNIMHIDEQERSTIISTLCNKPFDLLSGDVFHATWLQESETSGYLVIVIHHIVCDGVSIELLGQELITAYNLPDTLSKQPALQYVDFVQWQNAWLKEGHLAVSLQWWKDQLQDLPSEHKLPLDFSRPQQVDTAGDSVSGHIDKEVLENLRNMAQKNNTTMFVLVQALFSIVISKFSRASDIVLGTPIANREEKGLASAVGLFLNNVVLRNNVEDKQTLAELVEQVAKKMVHVMLHQHVPFEQVVDAVNPPRHLGIHPLFQIMINHQKRGEGENFFSDDGVKLTIIGQDANAAKYDLTAYLVETPDTMKVTFNFQTSIFSKERIEHMFDDFLSILSKVNIFQHSFIGDIKRTSNFKPFIATGSQVQISNQPILSIIRDHCLNRFSDRTILSDGRNSLTGAALWQSVLSAAAELVTSFNVQPGDAIAIAGEKNTTYITHLLAVNLIGAIAVPLGLDIPEKRLATIINSAGIKFIIGPLEHSSDALIHINELNQLSSPSSEIQPFQFGREHPMYFIFTSGSTGVPKGVMGTEYGLLNRCQWMQERFKLEGSDTSMHLTEMGYIRAMWEFYLPLLQGKALHLIQGNYFKDLSGFSLQLEQRNIHQIVTAPSILKAVLLHEDQSIASRFNCLRYWFVSGEMFPYHLMKKILALLPNIEIVNLYGSTEVTSDVSFCSIDSSSSFSSAGYPIDNTSVMVIDKNDQILPPLVVGEVVVSGAGVALGYINNAAKMAETFCQLSALNNDIVYKTGDLGYLSTDGQLILLGREDEQISIRGYRVELGEIESAISQLDFVNEFALLPIPHTQDGYRIVAFVCSDVSWIHDIQSTEYYQGLADARELLAKQLPHYMLPNQFVVIDKVPLKSNGKVDRDALFTYLHQASVTNDHALPVSKTEIKLGHIWQDVLNMDQIALDDMFFDVGGNSLLATQVINRIETEFGISMPLKQIFTHPTLRWLSQSIENALFITSLDDEHNVTEEYEEFEL